MGLLVVVLDGDDAWFDAWSVSVLVDVHFGFEVVLAAASRPLAVTRDDEHPPGLRDPARRPRRRPRRLRRGGSTM